MGRSKARKPKKPPKNHRVSPLETVLTDYSRTSLWALLDAAGRSPACRTRWGTVEHLVGAALRLRTEGNKVARVDDLGRLLAAGHADDPRIAQLEDFTPEDPRDVVRVAVLGRLYRLFPGNVERPIADIDRMLSLAAIADAAVVTHHGFRVMDLITAVLDHIDRSVEAASAAWPVGDLDLQHPVLHPDEIHTTAADTDLTAAQVAALNWATTPASAVKYVIGDPNSVFGSTLRFVLPGEDKPRWLPLAVLPEALANAVATLASEAAKRDWTVEKSFSGSVAAQVRRRLWRFADTVVGPPDVMGHPVTSPNDAVQWFVPVGEHQALAVQIFASLRGRLRVSNPPAAIAAARAARAGRQHDAPLSRGRISIASDMSVIPVLVGASSRHLMMSGPPEAVHLSLEDLDWIASTANDDADLWHFARELTDPRAPELFGLETINIWEAWRDGGGALFRGASSPSAMAFELHRGSAEWARGIARTPLEDSLHRLRLPPVRGWDFADARPSAPFNVANWTGGSPSNSSEHGSHGRGRIALTLIHPSVKPVAVQLSTQPSIGAVGARVLHDIAGALMLILRKVDATWVDVAGESNLDAVRIILGLIPGPAAGSPFSVTSFESDGRVFVAHVAVDVDALAERADGKPDVAHALLSELLSRLVATAGASTEEVERVRAACLRAPMSLTVQTRSRITERVDLPLPIEIEAPLLAQVDRIVADAVREAGVAPGRFGPEQAKALDTEIIAPAALSEVHERLARFRPSSVVLFGMQQLERVIAHRDELDRGVEQSAGALALDWDPAQRLREIEVEYLRLRRSNELIIELALRGEAGKGTVGAEVDERAWAEILAGAANYLEATGRSESLHFQVVRSGLAISDLYELDVVPWDDGVPDEIAFDHLTFAQQAASARLGDPPPSAPDDHELERLMVIADVEFKRATGTTVGDISLALLALTGWQLKDQDADAVAVPRAEALAHIAAVAFDESDQTRAAAALDAIISQPDDYVPEDWRPWQLRSRRTRLVTRPVPLVSDGTLVLAPHFCEAVFKVYQGYWQFGQLPWTRSLSSGLDHAMADVRSHRNLTLEHQVAALLTEHGWSTIVRVKPGDGSRLSIPVLTTEIDIVCGRPDSPTIHLLEVKDPTPVFTPPEIRRQLNTFFEGPKSYAAKLQRKRAEVEPYLDAVAGALGLPAAKDRRMNTRFVTRRPVPAAFAGGPFPFSSLSRLAGDLTEQP